MIYILCGPVRTGKTSALLKWSKNRIDVDGLLCPDGENGKRYFINIRTQHRYDLEVEAQTEADKIISIGPYHFLKPSFKKANDYLNSIAQPNEKGYLIIDEIGKLELKHQGLHESALRLIHKFMFDVNSNLILVVRDSLINEVLQHYNILKYSIITIQELKSLT